MTTSRVPLAVVIGLALTLSGCKSGDFDADKAKGAIESQPVHLEAEQVSLTQPQVDCGVDADLWEHPAPIGQDRFRAHLSSKGSALKFNDDVLIGEPDYRSPFGQVRGDFPIQVDEITSFRDGDEPGTKLVEAKCGIKVQHNCFQSSLPLMGVKRGNFSETTPVSFLLKGQGDDWKVEKVVH